MSELQFLSKTEQQCLAEAEAAVEAVDRAKAECNRILLSSEKTTGPIAHALRTVELAGYSIDMVCRLVHDMHDELGKLRDDCQAYTLGVQAGVRMVLDMLTHEGQAARMRASPDQGREVAAMATHLARWIGHFHDRVREIHGIERVK